ncbi:hypothetical protein MD537_23755, partial [Flavihumibacter sediminis]|nr:hypothetical protein [Flavihumibacter sediminis]
MRKKICCPVILSILFILQGCQKQTSINKEETCYHTQENVISDSSVYELTYHYDQLNRLIFVDRP